MRAKKKWGAQDFTPEITPCPREYREREGYLLPHIWCIYLFPKELKETM